MKLSPGRHNEAGEEVLDDTPMQPPVGYKKQVSLHEQIMQKLRLEKILRDEAIAETDDEADDFEVGDDFVPLSKHENDHVPSLKQLKAAAKKINEKIEEAKRKKAVDDYKKKGESEKASQKVENPPGPVPENS